MKAVLDKQECDINALWRKISELEGEIKVLLAMNIGVIGLVGAVLAVLLH